MTIHLSALLREIKTIGEHFYLLNHRSRVLTENLARSLLNAGEAESEISWGIRMGFPYGWHS